MRWTAATKHGWLVAVCIVPVVAGALTGCGGSGGTASTPASSRSTATSGSGSPSPTSSPTGEAEQFGPATLVKGQVSCRLVFGPVTTDDDGTMHGRDGKSMCTFTMNDPRVTGQTNDTWLIDKWAGAQDSTILIQWGDTVLKTGGGTWTGTYSGSYDNSNDYITYWYRGAGAYKGLTFNVWLTGPGPEDQKLWTYLVEGIIYPGTPPEAAPTTH